VKKTSPSKIPLAPALLRGLDILEDLHAQTENQSVSAIAERLQLPANSTLRLLATLEATGYVERDPDSLNTG
jgi:DNA-binding IclR family transcriptional regulator